MTTACIETEETSAVDSEENKFRTQALRARAVAFYLPQFHPTPENNQWWGSGFTEWTNVARAKPLFRGHQQPNLPADLGFYDLRCEETREQQATLAASHGIEAFCYWHYWFAGRRILQRPFQEVLETGRPYLSFCLGWANHTWSGIWDGAPNRILIEQTYPGKEDDIRHFDHLLDAFRDPRYLRVQGKPVFYIFRPLEIPNPREFCDRWQNMAHRAGLGGLYLVAEISDLLGFGPKCGVPRELGFDAGVYIRIPAHVNRWQVLRMRCGRKLLRHPEIYEYADTRPPRATGYDTPSIHPCVYPNWDNTPRSGRRGLVVKNGSPELFGRHVQAALHELENTAEHERFLFIKSWNEWAEGNHLEPNQAHGNRYLQALKSALNR
jgi:lipopolysaccharide biosynthesis protein